MKLLRYSLAIILLASFLSPLSAQEYSLSERGCGTVGKSDWLVRYQAGEIPPVAKSAATEYVPMNVVFVGTNEGAGYINPVNFLRSMELLNDDFRDQNIQFFISGDVNLLPSSRYDDHTFTDGRQMMSQNNIPRHLNTYVVANPAGACGYYSPSRDAIALGENCLGANDRTWSHEVGHYLSLPHTFYGWESVEEIDNIDRNNPAPATVRFNSRNVPVERTDSSNCNLAADGFCDTAPDYLMQRWPCTGNGIYRDSLLDPDSVRFAVPAWNIMSYANDNCVTGFSEEQKTAMLTNLDGRLGLVNNVGASTDAADGSQLNLIFPENNSRTDYYNEVELEWSSVPNADFYIVQYNSINNFGGAVLASFFVTDTTAIISNGLSANRDYFWRIRPVNRYVVGSDFGDQVWRFRTGRDAVSSIDPALNAAITVAPNPVLGGQDLRISGRELGTSGEMTYELIDAAGRILLSRANIAVSAAGFNERIETEQLPAGMYFLRLRLNDKLVSRRVVVTP